MCVCTVVTGDRFCDQHHHHQACQQAEPTIWKTGIHQYYVMVALGVDKVTTRPCNKHQEGDYQMIMMLLLPLLFTHRKSKPFEATGNIL